jgi:hypothetical protein
MGVELTVHVSHVRKKYIFCSHDCDSVQLVEQKAGTCFLPHLAVLLFLT